MMSNQKNIQGLPKAAKGLYVVATPIGNLGDMVPRALEVLQSVDVIAAEDTRHSGRLLDYFGITTRMLSFHDHSAAAREDALLDCLRDGQAVALISDAGTPLISDPGYSLVRRARESGINVVPIPGACAAIAALSVSGLPADRFIFEGFLPATHAARVKRLQHLVTEVRTLVFYEAPHRVLETLQDMVDVFGAERQAVVARELTKLFETVYGGTLLELQALAAEDTLRGEMVLVVHGADAAQAIGRVLLPEQVLDILLAELPIKQAAALAAKLTGERKNVLYERALQKKSNS